MPRHLFLLRELVKRDFRGRYTGSLLGFFWSFVQPLWLLLLFSFVFATVLKVPLVGQRTENFGLFLFAGLLPWMAIQEGLMRSATAVTDNAPLVKKLAFPSEILVVAAVLGAVLHELIGLGLFVVVLAVMGELSPRALPMLAVALPLQLVLTFGGGLLLAAVNVFFRDVAQLVGMVLTGVFYFTPIVYPLSLVPPPLDRLVAANPLASLVELYRIALLGDGPALPPGTAILAGAGLVLAAGGWWVYRRLQPGFVDEI